MLYYNAATSTAVERAFSQGRQLLHFTRNRLSPISIRRFLCLAEWSRHDMIKTAQLVSYIKKGDPGKGKGKAVEPEPDDT